MKSYQSHSGVQSAEFGCQYYASVRPEMAKLLTNPVHRALDIGCGNGAFAAHLKQSGLASEVWGIEIFESAAKDAAAVLHQVLIGDAANQIQHLPVGYFDAIFFNDSLEHMADPYTLLDKIKSHLAPGGVIIASLPNVRHIRTLFELIVKRDWHYRDTGVLDRTHLRFFTQKSARRMFEEAGLNVELSKGIEPTKEWYLHALNILTFKIFDDTLYYQFAWRARA